MLLFLNLGAGEIFIIALFVLMFFGSKEIPSLMRALGRSMREFKDAMNGIEREVRNSVNFDITADSPTKPDQILPPAPPTTPKELEEKKAADQPG